MPIAAALLKPLAFTGGAALLLWLTRKKETPLPQPPAPPPPAPQPPAPEPDVFPPDAETAVVIGDGVRLRNAPNTGAAILTTLPKGTRVGLVEAPFEPQNAGEKYAWWQIVLPNGQAGWAYSQYISLSGGAVPKDEEEDHRRKAEREAPIFQGNAPYAVRRHLGLSPHGAATRAMLRRGHRPIVSGRSGFGWGVSAPRESRGYYVRCMLPTGCRIRSMPSPSAPQLGALPFGATARVMGQRKGWLHLYLLDASRRPVEAWAPSTGWVRA